MLVNMFDTLSMKNDDKNKEKPEHDNININTLRDYVINNYLKYLQDENKEKLKEFLKVDLVEKFGISDIKNVEKIIEELLNKIFGYGILQKYIEDGKITDIRVVKYNLIYIKKYGTWEKINESFNSEEEYSEYVRFCALKNNATINYDVPIIVVSDKKYNLRIEIGIEPVNCISPSLVIRIHPKETKASLEELFLKDDMLDCNSYKIILDSIENKKSIIIAGKGGSGKTTLLRAIIDKIPENTSITINEETMELNISGKNVIQREVLESRNKDKKITLEKLMKHSMVMSNDVIVVGEIKGEETSVFIDAISTGHMGLATVHADKIDTILDRLVVLFKRDIKAQNYKEEFILQIFANSIDLLVFVKDFKVTDLATIKYNKKIKELELNLVYERGTK